MAKLPKSALVLALSRKFNNNAADGESYTVAQMRDFDDAAKYLYEYGKLLRERERGE